MDLLKIDYIDLGICMSHNYPCPIYVDNSAVYMMGPSPYFAPSWEAQREGWRTIKLDSFLKKLIYKIFFTERRRS